MTNKTLSMHPIGAPATSTAIAPNGREVAHARRVVQLPTEIVEMIVKDCLTDIDKEPHSRREGAITALLRSSKEIEQITRSWVLHHKPQLDRVTRVRSRALRDLGATTVRLASGATLRSAKDALARWSPQDGRAKLDVSRALGFPQEARTNLQMWFQLEPYHKFGEPYSLVVEKLLFALAGRIAGQQNLVSIPKIFELFKAGGQTRSFHELEAWALSLSALGRLGKLDTLSICWNTLSARERFWSRQPFFPRWSGDACSGCHAPETFALTTLILLKPPQHSQPLPRCTAQVRSNPVF